jgi:predicted DNA-binding transcriptional regulator AlpA
MRRNMNPIDNNLRPKVTTREPPLLYKISSVMDLLQVSHATVYRLVASGELKLVKLSTRASRITSESVSNLLGRQGVHDTKTRDRT